MQTPRNFQTFADTQKCTWNKCPNPARPGKDTCKQHRNSKTQLARKSMSRLLQWYAEHRPHEHESLETSYRSCRVRLRYCMLRFRKP